MCYIKMTFHLCNKLKPCEFRRIHTRISLKFFDYTCVLMKEAIILIKLPFDCDDNFVFHQS